MHIDMMIASAPPFHRSSLASLDLIRFPILSELKPTKWMNIVNDVALELAPSACAQPE